MFNVLLTSMNCGGVTWPDLWSGPRIGDSSKTNHVRTNHGLSKKVYNVQVFPRKNSDAFVVFGTSLSQVLHGMAMICFTKTFDDLTT